MNLGFIRISIQSDGYSSNKCEAIWAFQTHLSYIYTFFCLYDIVQDTVTVLWPSHLCSHLPRRTSAAGMFGGDSAHAPKLLSAKFQWQTPDKLGSCYWRNKTWSFDAHISTDAKLISVWLEELVCWSERQCSLTLLVAKNGQAHVHPAWLSLTAWLQIS